MYTANSSTGVVSVVVYTGKYPTWFDLQHTVQSLELFVCIFCPERFLVG